MGVSRKKQSAKVFGTPIGEQKLKEVFGFDRLTNGEMKVTYDALEERLYLKAYEKGKMRNLVRFIGRDHNGKLYCENKIFFPNKRNKLDKDEALITFAREVAGLRELGVEYINAHGVGDFSESEDYSGYYVWPRFGYNAKIPTRLKKELIADINSKRRKKDFIEMAQQAVPKDNIQDLPEYLKKAKDMHDLMATPEGRAWWLLKGDDIDLTFNLKDGSEDIEVLRAYLKKRGIKIEL